METYPLTTGGNGKNVSVNKGDKIIITSGSLPVLCTRNNGGNVSLQQSKIDIDQKTVLEYIGKEKLYFGGGWGKAPTCCNSMLFKVVKTTEYNLRVDEEINVSLGKSLHVSYSKVQE